MGDRILAWMALGLSHSDNSYISIVKFYKYTLAPYIMFKKNLYTTYRFMVIERKDVLNQRDQGSRQDIKMILYYARTY